MALVQSLSHSAICVHDLQAAKEFYCGILGAHTRAGVNFVTEDTIKGRSVHQSIMLEDYLIALVLAGDFMPMPPDDQLRGASGFRHAFAVSQDRFGHMMALLTQNNLAYEGPVEHPRNGPFGQSIYLKDPSGNFLEILWRRDEAVAHTPVEIPDVE